MSEDGTRIDDPYLRAIFAFIADDDWWDVLDESSLSLRSDWVLHCVFFLIKI